MTETTTLPQPPHDAASSANNLADILMNLIVSFLAPMFLSASGGDIMFARAAALKAVNAYFARNEADLISIAQIIAFSLAALGSLSLSMADNLSLPMTLRLRGNANACNRSAEQNRRALKESRSGSVAAAFTPPVSVDEPDDDFDEAEVLASVMATQKRAAEANVSLQNAVPAAEQTPTEAPAAVAPAMAAERQHQAAWAGAMVNVAAEITAELINLPPAERKMATVRAAALSSCANDLLSGKVTQRLRPGDLNALMQSNRL